MLAVMPPPPGLRSARLPVGVPKPPGTRTPIVARVVTELGRGRLFHGTAIDGAPLSVPDIVAVARGGEKVAIAPRARAAIERSRRAVEEIVRSGRLPRGPHTGVAPPGGG